MAEQESSYVVFAKKGKYRLSMRTHALFFGGANIHIDREDGGLVFLEDVKKIFKLTGKNPNNDKLGSYVSLSFELFADIKDGETTFINRRNIGFYPEALIPIFNTFLEYLEVMGAEVDYHIALNLYMITVQESLERDGFYPPKGVRPEKVEFIKAKVGGVKIDDKFIIKESE